MGLGHRLEVVSLVDVRERQCTKNAKVRMALLNPSALETTWYIPI